MWTVAKYESVQLVCFTRWLYECMCDIFEVLYLFWIYFTRAKSITSIYNGFHVKTQMTFKIILKFRKSLKFGYLDFVNFGNIVYVYKIFLKKKKYLYLSPLILSRYKWNLLYIVWFIAVDMLLRYLIHKFEVCVRSAHHVWNWRQ